MGRDPSGDEERERRYRLAVAELEAGHLAKATNEFVWLWTHITPDYPALVGVRVSYMARQIAALVERHAPARKAFRKLRDDAGDPQHPSFERNDWITLNTALGEQEKTLAWIDECLANDKLELLRREEHLVFSALVENRRWKDAGRIVSDPAARVRFLLSLEDGLDGASEMHRRELRRHILGELAMLVRTLRAARRGEEATDVLERATRFDRSVLSLARRRRRARTKAPRGPKRKR